MSLACHEGGLCHSPVIAVFYVTRLSRGCIVSIACHEGAVCHSPVMRVFCVARLHEGVCVARLS